MIDAAHTWLRGGFSVIPIKTDGTKATLFPWRRFMSERPSPESLDLWWGGNPKLGIGLICGAVSGNLELLELEGIAHTQENLIRIFEEIRNPATRETLSAFWDFGFVENSPSGGLHLLYRIADHEVPGNTKLASRPSTPEELEKNAQKVRTLAETRGEGGYVVVAPTTGSCHRSGRSWETHENSSIGWVPTISWEDRCEIHRAVTTILDEMPEPEVIQRTSTTPSFPRSDGTRPGDDFNDRVTWDEILEPHGWARFNQAGARGEVLWVRPGKNTRDGHSASTGYANDADRLYVWSSSTEFETERPYTKFAAYALLNYGGDHSAAARELRGKGFGNQTPDVPVAVSAGWTPNFDPMTPTPSGPVKLPSPAYSLDIAKIVAKSLPTTENVPHLARWRGEWYKWNGSHWKPFGAEDMASIVYGHVEDAYYIKGSGDKAEEVRWPASPRNVNPIVTALGSRVLLRPTDTEEDRGSVFCANGVVENLASRELLPPSPKRFNLNSVPHDFDPQAQCPGWLRFLDQVLPDDKQAQDFLQEWFGYVLSGRTDLQKMADLVGSKRSGKGTIGRILTKLIGQEAVASPTLDKLGTQFGEQGLIGKSLAIMSDVKWNRAAATEAVPSLLAIIGEDGRSVPRKNMVDWDGQLGVRFMAMSNDSPKFSDASGAMASRMIHLHFRVSFLGRENQNLTSELSEELAGILNWALDGLDRLNAQGRFTEPKSGQAIADEVEENSAPIRVFVKDCAVIDPEAETTVEELHRVYEAWYRGEGYDHAPVRSTMSRDLKSAFVDQGVEIVRVRRTGDNGTDNRVRIIRGIKLQDWVKTDPKYSLKWLTGNQTYHPRT